ncbi:MAG: discoidin domain-containing protein [Cyanobacteriota bacterium]|nr:discoidin domain-containing protein [Cyanobacteriota bacterium]
MVQAAPLIATRGVNIAPTAHCTQSSLSTYSTSADEANDVVRNPERLRAFVNHTDLEENPWFLIDFGQPVSYDEILVFNRIELPERVRHLVVDISVDGEGWHRIYTADPDAAPFGGTDGHPLRITTPGYETRYIRFQLQETTCLHFVAVEVYRW